MNQLDLEALVEARVKEIIGSMKSINTMYVEPGDVVIVSVSNEADESTLHHLKNVLSKVFNENKGVFVTENIEFSVIKKSDKTEKS